MKNYFLIILILKTLSFMAQNMNPNPLLCDLSTGVCQTTTDNHQVSKSVENNQNKIRVIYFTDPICSSCWGIEPQLRKLKLEYPNDIEISYHMGGLLRDWSYNSGGISKPSDVATHWDEVSHHYDMPIDGDVWLENPLHSSYPPSIAFKAAQLQDPHKALIFLRELRQMVFLQKKDITQWEHIAQAGQKSQLDVLQLKKDYEGQAKKYFEQDLALGQKIGVRGFPTIIFVGEQNQQEVVYGARPYSFFETALLKVNPNARKIEYNRDWKSLFTYHSSYTLREFSELSGMTRKDSQNKLNELTEKGFLTRFDTKNGAIWIKK